MSVKCFFTAQSCVKMLLHRSILRSLQHLSPTWGCYNLRTDGLCVLWNSHRRVYYRKRALEAFNVCDWLFTMAFAPPVCLSEQATRSKSDSYARQLTAPKVMTSFRRGIALALSAAHRTPHTAHCVPATNVTIFWDISPCSPYGNRCFGGNYDLHLQGRKTTGG
jgi:hypothetical protein